MKKTFIFVAIACLFTLSFALDGAEEGQGPPPGPEDGGIGSDVPPVAPLENDDVDDDEEPINVKGKKAAGHGNFGGGGEYRRRGHLFAAGGFRRGYGGGYGGYYPRRRAYVEHSTCSVQATYWLSLNQERRHCRDAVYEHDDCQACCEAATRRETRGVNKDDVTGFITFGPVAAHYRGKRDLSDVPGVHTKEVFRANYRERERQCVCCIPKKRGNIYY